MTRHYDMREFCRALSDLADQRDVLLMACDEVARVLREPKADGWEERLQGIVNAALSAVQREREVGG